MIKYSRVVWWKSVFRRADGPCSVIKSRSAGVDTWRGCLVKTMLSYSDVRWVTLTYAELLWGKTHHELLFVRLTVSEIRQSGCRLNPLESVCLPSVCFTQLHLSGLQRSGDQTLLAVRHQRGGGGALGSLHSWHQVSPKLRTVVLPETLQQDGDTGERTVRSELLSIVGCDAGGMMGVACSSVVAVYI